MKIDEKGIEAWKNLFTEWQATKRPMAPWCRENGISVYAFRYWRRQFEAGKVRVVTVTDISQSSFVELQDLAPERTGIELELNGITFRLSKNFDPATLKSCLKLVGEMKC